MNQYQDLDKAIAADASGRLKHAQHCEKGFELARSWLVKFSSEYDDDIQKALLAGSYSAAIEAVSVGYLGLMRSALFSLRTHYELAYAWLYYRDHPVEWRAVADGKEQARLPGAIDQYLIKYFPKYSSRWAILEKNVSRKFVDPYARMSAFVHGSYPNTMPTATKPIDIVSKASAVAQLPEFVVAVSESISDVFVSCRVSNWEALPIAIQQNLNKRLSGKAKSKLDFD